MKPFLLGAVLGLLVSSVGVGVVVWRKLPERLEDTLHAWKPRPTLTLTRDVERGGVLMDADLEEVSFPEQFVSISFVAPEDRRAVLGQPVTVALAKGDVLSWTSFARRKGPSQVQACIDDVLPVFQEAGKRARETVFRAMAQRSGASSPPPPSIPALKFGPDEQARVVVVKEFVREGHPLTSESLETRRVPRALVTASTVPAEALRKVVGATAVISLLKGDVLRWQFLDDPVQPRSIPGCMLEASAAADMASAAAAREGARAFVEGPREGR